MPVWLLADSPHAGANNIHVPRERPDIWEILSPVFQARLQHEGDTEFLAYAMLDEAPIPVWYLLPEPSSLFVNEQPVSPYPP